MDQQLRINQLVMDRLTLLEKKVDRLEILLLTFTTGQDRSSEMPGIPPEETPVSTYRHMNPNGYT